MNEKEFKEIVDKLMLEMNKEKIKYNIFIYIVDIETLQGTPFGLGCAACCAARISVGYVENKFQHNVNSATHLTTLGVQ